MSEKCMAKNVIISVKGSRIENQEESAVEMLTEGKLCRKKGIYYIVYKELLTSGQEGTTTMIQVNNEQISMVKKGTVNFRISFDKGKKNVSYYATEAGILLMGIMTNETVVNLNDMGGNIYLEYHMEMGNQVVGTNHLEVSVREQECCPL